MGLKGAYTKMNYFKSFIKFNSLTGSKENMFKINLGESDEHRLTKFNVCVELIKRGYSVFTEVKFNEGGIGDVVAFDSCGNGKIFEIVHSEKEESIKLKLDLYPIDFELEVIYTNKPLELELFA